jgi:hypothetical protein
MNALRGRDVVDARDREHDPRLDVAHEIEPKILADQILLLQRATAVMATAQKKLLLRSHTFDIRKYAV